MTDTVNLEDETRCGRPSTAATRECSTRRAYNMRVCVYRSEVGALFLQNYSIISLSLLFCTPFSKSDHRAPEAQLPGPTI